MLLRLLLLKILKLEHYFCKSLFVPRLTQNKEAEMLWEHFIHWGKSHRAIPSQKNKVVNR